jgi:hypothetical protein
MILLNSSERTQKTALSKSHSIGSFPIAEQISTDAAPFVRDDKGVSIFR